MNRQLLSMPTVQMISENWTLRPNTDIKNVFEFHNSIPAQVPGCVHEALLAAELIAEPYYECNENKLQWIGETDWCYECVFDADETLFSRDNIDMVCEGLDTIAEIELNGEIIGRTYNMHHPHRFNVKSNLRRNANRLRITFFSAVEYARSMAAKLGDLPRVYQHPYNFIRKTACNFGWDWSPTLITCGPWKPISIEAWDSIRIESVRPLVSMADNNRAMLDIYLDLVAAENQSRAQTFQISVDLTDPQGNSVASKITEICSGQLNEKLDLSIDKPQLWWPIGYGSQPLYQLNIEILSSNSGQILSQWHDRIGLRTVELDTSHDEIGTKCVLSVNGKTVFCKGSNWVPDDCFLTRVDESRYCTRLQQVAAANMNIIRVWGGGIYESETFYRICDEMGILVWQDFLFACAMYPEDEPFPQLIQAEATHNIRRLSKHPSLVLWNGSNENLWAYLDWHEPKWYIQVGDRAWGKRYYTELLPQLLDDLDPTRPYMPSSPFSFSDDIHPLDDANGTSHIYDVWVEWEDYPVYRKHRPRFAAEFGFQAPATYSTFAGALSDNSCSIESAAWKQHQKAPQGDEKNFHLLQNHFIMPEDFDDINYLLQLNQARALTVACEWFRSLQPECMGVMYWQFNDSWPCISWSTIDHGQRPKPLWYAARRFFQNRLVTIQPKGKDLCLSGINDTDQFWPIDVTLCRMKFDGQILASEKISGNISPRKAGQLCVISENIAIPDNARDEFIVAQFDTCRATWFFDVDKNLQYPQPKFDSCLEEKNGRTVLSIHAHNLIRDIAVFVDRLDSEAYINEQVITLLPGETFNFEIVSRQPLSQELLTKRPVLQCANFYGNKSAVCENEALATSGQRINVL